MYVYYVCLKACDYRPFVARTTNRHGHWVVLDVDGWKKQF